LNTTVRHPDPNTDGRTHASNVNADDKSKSFASATVTQLDDPLNDNAPPNRPAVDHDAPDSVPTCPFPHASPPPKPHPLARERAAPRGAGGLDSVEAQRPLAERFVAASAHVTDD